MESRKYIYITVGALAVLGFLFYPRRAKAASYAKRWVGVSEYGFNAAFSNKVFEDMMRDMGWKGGEAWCMYFAKAVHYNSFKKDAQKIDKILTGSTQGSFVNASKDTTKTYKVVTSGRPRLGDIAIWQRVDNPSKGHAAVVIKPKGATFMTVEGNTNAGGSSEGDKVLIKERPLKYGEQLPNSSLKLRGFIRKITDII